MTCLVFALIGLALGLRVARDGKLGGFVVGIAVIFAYYMLMQLAESVTKGYYADPAAVAAGGHYLPPTWPAGSRTSLRPLWVVALVWRARYAEGRPPVPAFRFAPFVS